MDTGLTVFNPTGDFIFEYKHYIPSFTSSSTPYNSLWSIGVNASNGVLIGVEADQRKIRIYNRNNGSNSSIDMKTSAFSLNEWFTVQIKYENGLWSVQVGENVISYSKTFTPTFVHLNAGYASTRLRDFKIKPL